MTSTATATRRTMLVCVDNEKNNNKFYEVTLHPNGDVLTRWGRIPDPNDAKTALGGQTKLLPNAGEHGFDAAVAKKLRARSSKSSYKVLPILDGDHGPRGSADREQVRRDSHAGLAQKGFEGDDGLKTLIDRLVDANAHDLAQRSGGSITVADGVVRTALGVITKPTIATARTTLDSLQRSTEARQSTRSSLLNDYLSLVPQKTPRTRGWGDNFIATPDEFDAQRTLLDDLESSVDFSMRQASQGDTEEPAIPFRMQLAPLSDKRKLDAISRQFNETKNDHHGGSARMRLSQAWSLSDTQQAEEIAKVMAEVGGVRRMWHGTRAINVLSILSTGFTVMPERASNVTGRMFGPGMYFSEQSTKSLNYSRGTWAGTRDPSAFMLLVDVAMGKSYRPRNYGSDWRNSRSGGYHSIDVKAGTANVRNHEAIVWNLQQTSPVYLCEFR